MKELYIHIGTGKTGTSSIQRFLYNNSSLLVDKYKIKYCKTGLINDNHHSLSNNSYRISKNHGEVQKKIKMLRDEISLDTHCSRFIISSENFPGETAEEIESTINILSDVCCVKVIVYLRRQDEYLESWYAQVIKQGSIEAKISVLKERLVVTGILDYNKLIKKWSRMVGVSNITARLYEKNRLVERNVVNDFMAQFGINNLEDFKLEDGLINPSTSKEQIIILKNMAKYISDNKLLLKLLKPVVIETELDNKFLSLEERMSLVKDYEHSNAEVFRVLGISEGFSSIYESLKPFSNDFTFKFYRGFVDYYLKNLQSKKELSEFKKAVVNFSRDTAIKLENTNVSLALEFMSVARQLRPDGPIINSRINMYLNKLK